MTVLPSQHCCYGKATDDSHELLHVKNQGLETFPQAASLHLRLICTRPCLWLCVVAADKVRTDVFGVIFTPPPKSTILSSLPPVSSSSNLGLIVFVIKHSCTDPSVNPLTLADYMGVRGLFSHTDQSSSHTPHMVMLYWPLNTDNTYERRHFLLLDQSQD